MTNFESEILDFFSDDEIIDKASLNGGRLIAGIFDSDFELAFDEEIASQKFNFTCPTGELLNVTTGDVLTLIGLNYKIIGIEPNGTGITILRLHKQ